MIKCLGYLGEVWFHLPILNLRSHEYLLRVATFDLEVSIILFYEFDQLNSSLVGASHILRVHK